MLYCPRFLARKNVSRVDSHCDVLHLPIYRLKTDTTRRSFYIVIAVNFILNSEIHGL